MKFNQKEIQEEFSVGDMDTINIKVSQRRTDKMMGIFLSNMYSNPIGAIVREITSNCFDAHVEAGVDSPVYIKLTNEEGIYFINFIDNGKGMTPEFIKNIYCNLLESTKEESNDFIGAWGLGSKTPLSLRNEFYLTTTVDGIEYSYLVFKNGTGLPDLTLMTTNKTDKPSGTIVKVEVERNEIDIFKKNIKEQLCYFDNVFVEGFSGIENTYSIIESDYFYHRNSDSYSNYPHIVLGKVPYPINFSILGLDSGNYRNLDIGIKFNIGDIPVQPNRESITYSEDVINLIKEKLELSCNYLIELYNNKNKDYDNFQEYLKYNYFKQTKNLFLHLKGNNEKYHSFVLNYLYEFKKELFKEQKFEVLKDFNYELITKSPFYFITINYTKNYRRTKILEVERELTIRDVYTSESKTSVKLINIKGKLQNKNIDKLKIKYLNSLNSSELIYFKLKKLTLKEIYILYSSYLKDNHDLNRIRNIFKFNKIMLDLLKKDFTIYDYENLEVPQQFIENNNIKIGKAPKIEGTISVYDKILKSNRSIDLSKEFTQKPTNNYLNFKNGILIVGFKHESKILTTLANFIISCWDNSRLKHNFYRIENKTLSSYRHSYQNFVKVMVISKGDLKHFYHTDFKVYHVSEILTSMRTFIKLNSYYTLQENKILQAFNEDSNILTRFSKYNTNIANQIKFLQEKRNYINNETFNLIKELRETYPLLKENLLPEIKVPLKQINDFFSDIPEAVYFNYALADELTIVNYFKSKKKPINLNFYKFSEYPQQVKDESKSKILIECKIPDLLNYNPKKIKFESKPFRLVDEVVRAVADNSVQNEPQQKEQLLLN